MIAHLQPVRQRIWLLAFGCMLVFGIGGVVLYFVLSKYLPKPTGAIALSLLLLLVALTLAKTIADYAIKYVDYLARAVVLATHKNANVDTPQPRELGAGRAYINSLALSIYRLLDIQNENTPSATQNTAINSVLLKSLPVPVFAINNSGMVIFANEVAAEYLQTNTENLINRPFNDVCKLSFISEVTLDAWVSQMHQKSVIATETWERVRLQITDKQSTRKQFDLVAHFSKDQPDGLELVLVFFDRTRLYEQDDHDLTFVSLAVHELRTPLTVMRGYIEVFEDELKDQLTNEQAEFMANMSASAQQLSAFVSNILNVVRIEENAMSISMKEEKWPQVLENASKDIGLRATVHGKKLLFDIPDDLPTVAVDKVAIHEVINNLLDNAIKYTHTDETITIVSREKNGFIETEVSDKGVGIPPAILAHLFDKFYRAHTSKNSVGGTGLGLYLSKAIVQAHGGKMWVTSKEGQGSTFGFSLPIFSTVSKELSVDQNGEIVRGAHGWIKNHTLYRG